MRCERRLVGAPASMRAVRARRLLRLVTVAAREQACGLDKASVHAELRTGEDWFWSFETNEAYDGPELAAPTSHPVGQPTPGPKGRVPADWQQHIH